MLGDASGIFIGFRPADVRLALKLGPDVKVLVYPQYGALPSRCQDLLSSNGVLITVVAATPGPYCEVLARFLDIGSDEGASW